MAGIHNQTMIAFLYWSFFPVWQEISQNDQHSFPDLKYPCLILRPTELLLFVTVCLVKVRGHKNSQDFCNFGYLSVPLHPDDRHLTTPWGRYQYKMAPQGCIASGDGYSRRSEEISNARLRHLKEKTLRYKFRMVQIPGVQHRAADAVSRHPTDPANPDMMLLPDDIAVSGTSAIPTLFNPSGHSFLSGIRCRESAAPYTSIDDELASLMSSSLNTLATTWDRIKVATASNTSMVQLISIIESSFPEFCHELSPALREYHLFRDHLYTVDGVILHKSHTVIPPSLCQHVLHSAHQGVTSMTAHAETTVFWPAITPANIATQKTVITAAAWHLPNLMLHPSLLSMYFFFQLEFLIFLCCLS